MAFKRYIEKIFKLNDSIKKLHAPENIGKFKENFYQRLVFDEIFQLFEIQKLEKKLRKLKKPKKFLSK